MNILVNDFRDVVQTTVDTNKIVDCIQQVFASTEFPPGIVEIALVDDTAIQELNRQYRQKNCVTNVLSFPQYVWTHPLEPTEPLPAYDGDGPPLIFGEIIIAIEKIKEDADEAGVPVWNEMIRMTIHGVLHLFGYDHSTNEDAEIMESEEEKYIDACIKLGFWMEG